MKTMQGIFLAMFFCQVFAGSVLSTRLVLRRQQLFSSGYENLFKEKTVVECSAVRKLNISTQCSFIRTTEDCHSDEGFIKYNQVIFCAFQNQHAVAFILLIIWLIYLFIALGVTAEEFFCPCLKTFAKSLRMSDNVAGVTLLALGNGAPDIFSVLAAITTGNNNAAPLAFQELYGSGMFVTTIVVGSIQLRSSFKLARRPFLRDVVFYISAVAWTFVVMYKKEIQTAEAVGFIVLYVVYVTLVIAGQAVNRSMRSYVRLNDHIQDIPPPAINDEDNQPESQRLRIFTKSAIEDFPADADFTEFEHGRSLLLKHQHVPHDVPKNYGSTNQVIVSRVEESGNEGDHDS